LYNSSILFEFLSPQINFKSLFFGAQIHSTRCPFHQHYTRDVASPDPESVKDWQLDCLFMLLGSQLVTATCKMMLKLTPRVHLGSSSKVHLDRAFTEQNKGKIITVQTFSFKLLDSQGSIKSVFEIKSSSSALTLQI